jgi:hypothetical protein
LASFEQFLPRAGATQNYKTHMLMKKTVSLLTLIAISTMLFAQKVSEIKIPMTASRWDCPPNTAEFITHKGVPAMKITSGNMVKVKDFTFENGTIEFDIEPQSGAFTGISFRMSSPDEREYFYLRIGRANNPSAMDAAQYAAYSKGVNLWDLLDHYQGPANFKVKEWNHVKMIVSGKQMVVYVNDISRPTLEIPRLEGDVDAGSLGFDGLCVIANLVISPNKVENLPAREGFDPTHHDPRYIRTWQVTEPLPLPRGRELFEGDFPNSATKWREINAERRGLVNLTRVFGKSDNRRFVWLRVKLTSETQQKRKMNLGFSDEVWVFLNKQLVFTDKNIYTSPDMRKEPDGRISVENGELNVTLRQGENELLVGVANDFFGWGVIAKVNSLEGIDMNLNFPVPLDLPKDLTKYLGKYKSPDIPQILSVAAENNVVTVQPTGQAPLVLDYFDKDKFRYEPAGIVLEFYPDDNKMVVKQPDNKDLVFTREQ